MSGPVFNPQLWLYPFLCDFVHPLPEIPADPVAPRSPERHSRNARMVMITRIMARMKDISIGGTGKQLKLGECETSRSKPLRIESP